MTTAHSPSPTNNASPVSNPDAATAVNGGDVTATTPSTSQLGTSTRARAREGSGEEERRGKRMKYVDKAW
jgi:hypothetical protein